MLNRKRRAIALIGITLIIATTMGCGFVREAETAIAITRTPTPSLTPSSTKRVCPPSLSLATPKRAPLSPHLVVILFDPELPGVMQYENGQTTSDVLEFSKVIFEKVTGPGDGYTVFRLGYHTYGDARVINEDSPTLEAPFIPSTPSPQPTLTPITPTPTYEGETLFLKTQVAKEYKATLAVHFATATHMAFEDGCARTDWVENYATQNADWEATKMAAKSNFLTRIATNLDAYQKRSQFLPTPYAQNSVFEGLAYATLVFQHECSKYAKCSLIIFDKLDDWRIGRDGKPYLTLTSGLEINLHNVEVASILLNCADIFQPDCKKTQDIWTGILQSFGVASPEYHTGEGLEDYLIKFLRREPND